MNGTYKFLQDISDWEVEGEGGRGRRELTLIASAMGVKNFNNCLK